MVGVMLFVVELFSPLAPMGSDVSWPVITYTLKEIRSVPPSPAVRVTETVIDWLVGCSAYHALACPSSAPASPLSRSTMLVHVSPVLSETLIVMLLPCELSALTMTSSRDELGGVKLAETSALALGGVPVARAGDEASMAMAACAIVGRNKLPIVSRKTSERRTPILVVIMPMRNTCAIVRIMLLSGGAVYKINCSGGRQKQLTSRRILSLISRPYFKANPIPERCTRAESIEVHGHCIGAVVLKISCFEPGMREWNRCKVIAQGTPLASQRGVPEQSVSSRSYGAVYCTVTSFKTDVDLFAVVESWALYCR